MAVAMEVPSWCSSPELLGSPVQKKRAWGADAQQLMQLMMNQLQHSPSETPELTRDLLGNADPAASSPSSQHQLSPEFLHLDPTDILPLPSGWEKCLDLQSGLIYFKDRNSGTLTYRDPRHESVPQSTQRIGLSSVSLSPEQLLQATTEDAVTTKRKSTEPSTTPAEDQSLELSLNLPGTPRPGTSLDGCVCTMEKVRSALQRSQWLHRRSRACTPFVQTSRDPSSDPTVTPSVTLSLLSPSNSQCLRRDSGSKSGTSPCSSEGFTSPSVMSFQGDDEEVQQPGDCRDSGAKTQIESPGASGSSSPVMVAVGCKSCLMYVMLSKSHPSCPKCCNTDVLLELPVPMMKKRRLTPVEAPSWSRCTA